MNFNCINRTGDALTLFDGTSTLMVLANNQSGQHIQLLVTAIKLGKATVQYARKSGAFVGGHTYVAAIENHNVVFRADGQPVVVFG